MDKCNNPDNSMIQNGKEDKRRNIISSMFLRNKKFCHVQYLRGYLLILFTFYFVQFLSAQNAIVTENLKTGNPASEWDISGAGDLSIQGFATDISVNKGQTIHFKINTDASSYTVNIYRMGYYGGLGARKVGTGIITVTLPQNQPNPLSNSSTGLLDCGNWTESAHWDVPATSVSGIYFARLTRSNGGASHIFFIVRDDTSHSAMIYKTSDGTWQAYNAYGGNSLYVGNTTFPQGHAAKVSYNRPFITRNGGGGGSAAEDWIFNAEYPMVRWLERNGYDITYFSNVDADRYGSLILNHKIFVDAGHDEYWSGAERNNVTAARKAGVNLAFFCGNEVYWKTRYENSIDGSNTNYRTLVCYKEGTIGENSCGGKCDPLTNVWTGLWRDGCSFPAADGCKPENALTGEISWVESTNPITVPASFKNYRFWRNTAIASLGTGQTATLSNGVLGYEWDFEQDNGSYPAGRVTLSSTTVGSNTHKLSIYKDISGAMVFGAGTIQWSWGLDGVHDRGTSIQDPKMQQATINLFADMGVFPGSMQTGMIASSANDNQPPATVITTPVNGSHVTPSVAINISGSASDAGVVTLVEVSVDGGITWTAATGTTSWSFSWTPPATGTFTIKSRGLDDLGNLESVATSTNTIQVTTGTGINCTPPTAVLTASATDCSGNSIDLKLTSATGKQPYAVVVNNINYTGVTVGQKFATVLTEETMWGNTGTPQIANDNDGTSIEVGVKFRTSQNGTINGIRFYKGSANTGTHTGSLWTSTGTRLASAVFTGETATGWQVVRFTTPVSIVANTTYIASYLSPAGGYSSTANFFKTGFGSGSVTALASGVDGNNGVYKYGSGFPGASFSNTNYWIDVLFKPASTYTFNLTSITDSSNCNNTGTISTSVINLSGNGQGLTYYQDFDGDGFGNPLVSIISCLPPAGYVTNNFDCNDSSAAIGKGSTFYRDNDKDGFGSAIDSIISCSVPSGYVSNNTDCNDSDATVYPGAVELCDGKDNNCNGVIDEGCSITVKEQTIWGTSGAPQIANDNDGTSIEVGVKFRASIAGTVNGIRFYKGSANTGTHTGSLWTSTGTRLASAVFTGETATGWQVVRFTTPVSIVANTTYIASYLSPAGGYSSTVGYFTSSGVTKDSLSALRSGLDGPNGLYIYGSGFPVNSYQASNYWVDVLFTPVANNLPVALLNNVITVQPRISIYPNPFTGCFSISGVSNLRNLLIKIYDDKGREIEVIKNGIADNHSLGCNYSAGIYIVDISANNIRSVFKIIKISR